MQIGISQPIESRIVIIRGHRVMFDSDLAKVYGVSTKRLNQQVQRNIRRFPPDFMMQLTKGEASILRLQFATSSRHGGRRTLPRVFTEHGAVMLSSVLNTETAVNASIEIARAFIKFRELISANRQLAKKLNELDKRVGRHDIQIHSLIDAIRLLTIKPLKPKPPIGFRASRTAIIKSRLSRPNKLQRSVL